MARRELEAIRKRETERNELELAALDREVGAALDREDFERAAALLEEARKRPSGVGWTGHLDERRKELDAVSRSRHQALKQEALEARRRGDEPEARRLRERVAKWGIASLTAEFDVALAAAPPAPPLSPSARAVDLAWEKALALVRARDFAGAAKELESVRDSIQDASLRDEVLRSAEIMKSIASLHDEAARMLSKSPNGGYLPLKVRDGRGGWRSVEGTILRTSAHRVELKVGNATAFLLVGELAADSLVDLVKSVPADARAAAAFCLLDADVASARRREGPAGTAVPERFWSAAAKISEASPGKAPAVLAREKEARNLLDAALRDYLDPPSRAACAEKCEVLLRDFADTAFVRRNRDAVVEGREAGKKYVLAAGNLAGAGTFQPSAHSKAGPCWTATEDVPQGKAKENYVEWAFSALPGTEYHCWVWVGACCAETFVFHYQATDLFVPDPKDRNRMDPAGPGDAFAVPVRHEIRYLKSTHAGHGGAKEPKRWEWVAIRLPKAASGGLKKVRLLSDQKGFSVAAAIMSTARRAPPSEAEVKEELELATARGGEPRAGAGKDGLRDLFNGKDLTGWRTVFGVWRVEDGAIVSDTAGEGGRFLIDTSDTFTDYEMTCKMSVTKRSYVEPRFHGLPKVGGFMLEVGNWHDFRGIVRRGKVEAFVNGKKVGEGDVEGGGGTFGFLMMGGEKLRIKDVRLRNLQ